MNNSSSNDQSNETPITPEDLQRLVEYVSILIRVDQRNRKSNKDKKEEAGANRHNVEL